MKLFFAFAFLMVFGSDIAICQEVAAEAASDQGLGAFLLPFLPAGAAQTMTVVFMSLGALNAVSMALEKIAASTENKKDDEVASKFKSVVMVTQKFLNFFIAKR